MKWTAEKIAQRTTEEIKSLRSNAQRLGATAIAQLCDDELARRAPPKNPKISAVRRTGQPVLGFHFVCPEEQDVQKNPDGTFWTGTWVVDENHAVRGEAIGAYVALHRSKSETSYLQGTVKGWRRRERQSSYSEGQEAKTRFGVDFLVEPFDGSLAWHGDATGEKGYFYGDTVHRKEVA